MMKMFHICFCVTVLAMASGAAVAQNVAMTDDQVCIAVQKICPVSGEELGSMGAPLKVKIGEEKLFLCCKGCVGRKVQPEHWGTVHKNFASAQKICAVMGHDIPKKPEWTITNGHIFFVCCPPCKEKIAADPDKYSAVLIGLYKEALKPPTQ